MTRRTHGRREVNSSVQREDHHLRGPRGGQVHPSNEGRRTLLSGLARCAEWLKEYDRMRYQDRSKPHVQERLAEILNEQIQLEEQLATLDRHAQAVKRPPTSRSKG